MAQNLLSYALDFYLVTNMKKPAAVKFRYPTLRLITKPTPDALFVCDKCGNAYWDRDVAPRVRICDTFQPRCKARMRRATADERAEALQCLVPLGQYPFGPGSFDKEPGGKR